MFGDGPFIATYVVVADTAYDHDYRPDDLPEAARCRLYPTTTAHVRNVVVGSGRSVGVLHGGRERLGALLRRRRVHPHDLPAVAVEVEEAA